MAKKRPATPKPKAKPTAKRRDRYSRASAPEPASPIVRAQSRDPAAGIPGMPPNMGRESVPHIATFTGTINAASQTYRPNDEALRHSREFARFMRNDPMVMECVEARQRGVALLNWHLEPEDAKSALQKQLAADLTKCIEDIPRFTQYRENCQHAIWYGRYGISQRWNWKEIAGATRVSVDRWKPVNGDKLVFRYDDGTGKHSDDQIGIRVAGHHKLGDTVFSGGRPHKVVATDQGLAYMLDPWEKPLLAIHKHMIEDGDFEDPESAGSIHGVGIRSRIYWAWYQKQEMLAQLVEYLERSANGIEIWYYPYGNPEAEKKTRIAAQERIGGGRNIILCPRPVGEDSQAYGVEHIEPGLGGIEALERIVSGFYGHQIKRYILGQILTSEAEATGLGSGVADLHLDTYLQIIRYDATNLEETITTELVDHLKAFNFPAARKVKVRFKIDTESPDVASKLEAWRTAYEMGLKIKAQALGDMIGAPAPDAGDEFLQHPQFQQMGQEQPQGAGDSGQPGGPDDFTDDVQQVSDNFQIMQRLGVSSRNGRSGAQRQLYNRLGGRWRGR